MQEPELSSTDWVTKSNMTDFVCCPRTYWLIARGLITHEESLAPEDRVRADDGVTFEEDIIEVAGAVDPISPEVASVEGPALRLQTGLFVNDERGLRGEPDGIDIGTGSWAPLEIKSHRNVTALDRLELAFYWLLLEGHRGDGDHEPHGYLILKSEDGPAEPQRIDLLDRHFTEVIRLVGDVRRTRTLTEPFGCGQCFTCREAHPQSVEAFFIQREVGYLTISVGLPPLSTQRHFAVRVAAIEHATRASLAGSESLEILFASLQQRAFTDEL